uniref:Uncharacterized protein n=1 Tax=Octopus bimaculoides TaxID=37653 RepID=A0A0L8GX22_OCTBM
MGNGDGLFCLRYSLCIFCVFCMPGTIQIILAYIEIYMFHNKHVLIYTYIKYAFKCLECMCTAVHTQSYTEIHIDFKKCGFIDRNNDYKH